MAATISLSPNPSLELSSQLRNIGDLGHRGRLSSEGARIWEHDCSRCCPFATAVSRRSVCSTTRDSTPWGLSGLSVSFVRRSSVHGIGRTGERSRKERKKGTSARLGGDDNAGLSDRSTYVERSSASCLSICENSDSKRRPAAMASSNIEEKHGFYMSTQSGPSKSGNAGGAGGFRSVGVMLGGVVLALGFAGLRFCKPAHAENSVDPPTLSASPLDRAVKMGESERSAAAEALKSDDVVLPGGEKETLDHSGRDIGSGDGEFEPPYGEGSDLTNDPAEVLLRSYLEMHPTDKKALQALLFLRLKKGEVCAAGPVLATLIELEPDNLEWKYIRAQADEFAGDLAQARRGFEEILQSKPLSARAWQGLAVIMHKTGEDEEALQMLMDAVKKAADGGQSQEVGNLRMLLGQLHTMQGNLEKAMELYKTVVEEDPKDYRPYLCQGLVYSIIGEEEEAEKYFRRYRKLCPKDFPQRGFLDELMLRAKSESKKLSSRARSEEELKKTGKKTPKAMRQPLASGGVSPRSKSTGP